MIETELLEDLKSTSTEHGVQFAMTHLTTQTRQLPVACLDIRKAHRMVQQRKEEQVTKFLFGLMTWNVLGQKSLYSTVSIEELEFKTAITVKTWQFDALFNINVCTQ